MPERQQALRKKGTVPFFLIAIALLAACGSSGTVVTRGGGASLEAALSDPALGGRYRVVVAAIIDKTESQKEQSFEHQLAAMNINRPEPEQVTRETILGGIRDMLVTELFVQDRFIVLERADLNAVVAEQEFSASARAGDATRIPAKQLEGSELIVLGAVTAFDAGIGGGALPIPVPLGDRGDFGVMHLRFKKGYVAMDLRVVDARTGRVLSSVAVNGTNSRFGMDFNVHLTGKHHRVKLPGVLTYFKNTPVEEALQKMVTAAVGHIAGRVEPAPPVN
jgi:curli biogenesis system outer membrane secretion channel CsgG